MRIVDSHCHVSLDWYEPVESLLFQMEQNGVDKAVLIQMGGQYDNAYQFECVRRFPHRFASVVGVNTDRQDAPRMLERLADEGASGVRLSATTRSPGDDPLALWRTAAQLKLTVSCHGKSRDFASPDFSELVQAMPELLVVIDHLGTISAFGDPDFPSLEISRKVFELARFPNVYIKVPGLGQISRRAMPVAGPSPFEQPITPLLELAYDAFGAHRMMWGTDFPTVSGREGYRNALRLTMEQFLEKSDRDRNLIFGEVAESAFPVRG